MKLRSLQSLHVGLAQAPGRYGDIHGPYHGIRTGRHDLARRRLLDPAAVESSWQETRVQPMWGTYWRLMEVDGPSSVYREAWPVEDTPDPAWDVLLDLLVDAGRHVGALEVLESISDSSSRRYVRGRILSQLGRHTEALELLEPLYAQEHGSRRHRVGMELGHILIQAGLHARAGALVRALEPSSESSTAARAQWLDLRGRLAAHEGEDDLSWSQARVVALEQAYGARHPATALARAELGESLWGRSELLEAHALQTAAARDLARARGALHPHTLYAGLLLAVTTADLGELAAALERFEEVEEGFVARLGSECAELGWCWMHKARTLNRVRRWDAALEAAVASESRFAALSLSATSRDALRSRLIRLESELGVGRLDGGSFAAAVVGVVEQCRRSLGAGHPVLAEALALRARTAGDDRCWDEAMEASLSAHGPEHVSTLLIQVGRWRWLGEPVPERVMSLLRSRLSLQHPVFRSAR